MSTRAEDGWPLTITRSMEDMPIGNVLFKNWSFPPGSDLESKFSTCRFPWDILTLNEWIVGAMEGDEIHGEVHALAVIEGHLKLGKGSRILPGVFIEGNVIIGDNCKIGPNCYIRGNTSIGNDCHIGQSVEVKNSVIFNGTNVGHLSYVGDSILGEGVNFGAGTNVSNLRHDGVNHRSMTESGLVDTGRRKLGAIIGDGVHTGIGTMIYPGRKIWPGLHTRPGDVVRVDLRPGK